MKSRLLALGMLFILVAALVQGVMAQDNTNFLCGTLSADDCTALTTAFANTGAAPSGALSITSRFDNESYNPEQAVKAEFKAYGKFSGAAPIALDLASIPSANPATTIGLITDNLKNFSGALTLTLNLPTTASPMTANQPLVIDLLQVNGVSYIDLSKFPAAMTAGLSAYNISNTWTGLDLVDILNNIGSALLTNLQSSSSGMATVLPQIQALLAKHLEYTRDGDTFTGELDLVGLLNDADFQALTNMKAATDSDKAVIAALKDVTVEAVFTLDGDKLSEIQVNVDVPESVTSAVNTSSTSKSPKSISFNLDVKYSGLGEAQTIAAPDGARVIKFAEFATMINDIFQKIVSGLQATPTPAS
jgi:hypothetical protein